MRDLHGEETLESMSQAIWYNQWTLGLFEKYLNGNILEVGCGIGNFTRTLTKYGKVIAIDINKDYASQTKDFVKNAEVGIGNIEIGKYFFNNQKFNSIICLNVLEHIKDDSRALKNLFDLLDNESNLILLIPSHPSLYGEIDQSIGHFRRYSKEELVEKMKKIGFKIINARRLNFLGAIGWFIAGRILKEKIVKQDRIKIFNILAPFILPIEKLLEPPIGTSILIIAQKDI